jgi:hypothetical protein
MEKGLEWVSEEGPVTRRGDIVRWWEARRYHFNVFVLAVGFASCVLVMAAGSAAVKPGDDSADLRVLIFGPGVYVAALNFCYTLGWVTDTILYNGHPRTWLYKSGLILAVALTAIPGVWAVVGWLITMCTGRKID